MKKLSTLFKKDITDLSRVINEIDPENQWVLDGESIPTRKYDGSACAIIDGELYRRYDAKKGKQAPDGAIPCQDADPITGHHPHWVKCERSDGVNKWFFVGFDGHNLPDGTYELCGEKVQGNPEGIVGHQLIPHGKDILPITDFSFEGLRAYFSDDNNNIEGIVFHHASDGRMCKIRKSDFGIKRVPR